MSKRAKDVEEIKRRKMARLRFRNLIRSVSLNRIWLVDLSDQKFSLNVKKNIAMLVRTQRKIGLLTMAEKSLIRTHHTLRTTEDRKKLVSLMASLTCFHKIPPRVRARLSKCIKFMVIGPGRKLIKEGDLPLMVYFVLTGEVEVTKRVYDKIKNTWNDRIEMISGPGDCLGDVEMIERCTRRHTYTSSNVVELLVVFEEDFESVLRPVMEKQWTDKKSAIMALGYFNFFTRDQVSQNKGVKTFELTDILTEDDTSSMFQNLANTELLKILREENNSAIKPVLDIDKLIASEEDDNDKQTPKTFDLKKIDIKSIEIKCGLHHPSSESDQYTASSITISEKSESSYQYKNVDSPFQMIAPSTVIDEQEIENKYIDLQKLKSNTKKSSMPVGDMEEGNDDGGEHIKDNDEPTTIKKIVPISLKDSEISQLREKEILAENIQLNRPSFDPEKRLQKRIYKKHLKKNALEDVPEEDSVDSKTRSNRTDKRYSAERKGSISSKKGRESLRGSIRSGDISSLKRSFGNLENHFIDVGSLTFGGIFGIGEKLEHRVIMARTTVQCLMIPRFWLFEKDQNPGNIWQRRRFYLDSTIPLRQTLFKDFLTTRQWQKFKKDIIQSHLNPNSTANPTNIQDVPIICRIVEASDD